MSYTNRSRVLLALLPLLVPAVILVNVVLALANGVLRAVEVFCILTTNDLRNIYRHIYRPARYGHVLDFPEEG